MILYQEALGYQCELMMISNEKPPDLLLSDTIISFTLSLQISSVAFVPSLNLYIYQYESKLRIVIQQCVKNLIIGNPSGRRDSIFLFLPFDSKSFSINK